MTALAWLLVAAILIAWAIEALWQHIDRRRDERDWQAMVDESEAAAAKWFDRWKAERTKRHAAEIANRGLRKTLAKAETQLAEQAERVFPAAPWPGEELRTDLHADPKATHYRAAANRAATADLPPSDLGKRRAAKKAVSKS